MYHVLVIENEWLIADHIGSLAETAGAAKVEYAATEAEAVAIARQSPPTMILSDVKLSDGTGPRAVQTIHSELGPIPTIFITGNPEACQPCGYAAAIINKPVIDHELTELIRRHAPPQRSV